MINDVENINPSDSTRWGIRVFEKPYLLKSLITGKKTNTRLYHAFIALTDETDPNNPVILDEIHFLPQNKKSDHFETLKAVILSAFSFASRVLSLEKEFTKATLCNVKFSDHLFFLTGVSYKPKKERNLSEIESRVYDSGSPKEMLHIWNNAYRAAYDINGLKRLFNTAPLYNRSHNCRSGVKAVVEALGYKYTSVVPQSRRGSTSCLSNFIEARGHEESPKPFSTLANEHVECGQKLAHKSLDLRAI